MYRLVSLYFLAMINQKEKLLRSAFKIYLEHGFRGISINEVIKKIGINKSSFYYYFKDKDSLLNDIVDEFLIPFFKTPLEKLEKSEGSAKEKIEEYYNAMFQYEDFLRKKLNDNTITLRDFFMLIVKETINSPSINSSYKEHYYNNLLNDFKSLLDEDKKKGLIPDDINTFDFARHIISSCEGLTYLWIINSDIDYNEHLKNNFKYIWRNVYK